MTHILLPAQLRRTGRAKSVATLAGLSAVALAAVALGNAALARRTERRNQPTGSFIEVDGVRLHYLDEGTGPVVVLLHGNQVMAEDFRVCGLLDLLARDHRVIAFDRPGFGHSTRPRTRVWSPQAQAALVNKALRRLGVERPVIVGHSLGALVALAYALDHPSDTRALLLLSGYYFPSLRGDVPMASLPAIPVLGDILRYTAAPLFGWLTSRLMLRGLFSPSSVPPRFAAELPLAMMLRPSQIRATGADAAMMVPAAAKLQARHRELTLPVSIIAGRGDKIVWPDGQAGRLHAELGSSMLDIFEGTGHMVHHADPARVAAAIEALLSASDAGAAAMLRAA